MFNLDETAGLRLKASAFQFIELTNNLQIVSQFFVISDSVCYSFRTFAVTK